MDESTNVFGVMALISPLAGFAMSKAVFLKELEGAEGNSAVVSTVSAATY